MGLSTSGLAFKPTSSTLDQQEMINRAFGATYEIIAASESRNAIDLRMPGNLALESTNGALFIYGLDIVEGILFDKRPIDPTFFAALGCPQVIVVFSHFDSGNTFGYRILENGVSVRARVYIESATSNEGTPKAYELPWSNAEVFFEDGEELPTYRNRETEEISTEGYVTARMLEVTMKALFGVCPWQDWNYKSKFTYYRKNMPRQVAMHGMNKAWWRFW